MATVVCLESDTLNTDTAGAEADASPPPGHPAPQPLCSQLDILDG